MLTVAEEEARLETQRHVLSREVMFEPYSAFSRIDRYGQGFVTARDVSLFLESVGMGVPESACAVMVKYFDSDPRAHQSGS